MSSREERVTLRFTPRELAHIDAFVEETEEVRSRSDLIRHSVRDFIRRKTTDTLAGTDEVLVPLSVDQVAFVDNLVRKRRFHSRSAALFEILRDFIDGVDVDNVVVGAQRLKEARYENAAAEIDEGLARKYLES